MKILFIIGVLDSGGVAKSIVNLLNAIDRKEQEVHLLVLSAGDGPFVRYIPGDVTVHRNPIAAELLDGFGGMIHLLKQGHLLLALGSMLRMFLSKIDRPLAGWLLGHLFPALDGEWDTIVDYNGQQDLYYMVDKLKGRKKITFFHSDYHKWPYYERMDRKYYPKVDAICTISEQCVQSLKDVFPEVSDKIRLFPNISLPSMIYRLAEESVAMPELHGMVLLSIGHVCYNKGVDIALRAAETMRDKGLVFTWLFLGSTDGAGDYLQAMAQFNEETKRSGSKTSLHCLGIQSNPYAYMKRADIIVHPSRFEGKSIALDEAKILCKPIVVTAFSTVSDQFEDGVNASICNISGESVANAIIDLWENKEKMNLYVRALQIEKNRAEQTIPNNLLKF